MLPANGKGCLFGEMMLFVDSKVYFLEEIVLLVGRKWYFFTECKVSVNRKGVNDTILVFLLTF